MSDLTPDEISLFHRYVSEDDIFTLDDDYDFFEGDEYMTDEITVAYWKWKDRIIIDIHGWPGDTQDRCLYLDDVIVATNGDGHLESINECPSDLKKDLSILEDLRREI